MLDQRTQSAAAGRVVGVMSQRDVLRVGAPALTDPELRALPHLRKLGLPPAEECLHLRALPNLRELVDEDVAERVRVVSEKQVAVRHLAVRLDEEVPAEAAACKLAEIRTLS